MRTRFAACLIIFLFVGACTESAAVTSPASQAEPTAVESSEVESSEVDVMAEVAAAAAHQPEPTAPEAKTATFEAAFDRDVFCEATPRVPAQEMLTRLDDATPEELRSGYPDLLADLDDLRAAAPNEVAGDVATVVDLLSEWQQVMTEAKWTLRLADIKDADRGSFLGAYMRIEDFAYDRCEGPWSRASELTPLPDEVRASDEWADYVSTYLTLDFTMDEAECLATALSTIEMTSLLGAYGFCGIELDRFLALAGS